MKDRAEYEAYMQDEWLLFSRDLARQQESVGVVGDIDVRRVLDVGCGGGQELIPFLARGAAGIGIDITHDSGLFAARLFQTGYPGMPAHFATAAAERLPFTHAAFDVVLCRVAIPYTDNRAALAEIARVLRPGGILLLKIHHLRYYTRKFADGIRQRSPLFSLHAVRVLISGAIFHLTGHQPSGGLLLRESFMTEWLLRKELSRAGLVLDRELDLSDPLAPSYRIVKPPMTA
jgi:SAM-dependent methyltransferase